MASSHLWVVGALGLAAVCDGQAGKPPQPDGDAGGGAATGCTDVLTWPCWMIGNASGCECTRQAHATGTSLTRLLALPSGNSGYHLDQLCDNNNFTWSTVGNHDTLGPTVRARDACCICRKPPSKPHYCLNTRDMVLLTGCS